MMGISSKAAGSLENKKKYNGIELNNDFDLNIYDAFYRNLDVQTGRWWEIDPKTENQEYMSPYTSMGNDPVRYSDFLGDEQEELGGPGAGALAADGVTILAGAVATAGAGTVIIVGTAAVAIVYVATHPEVLLSGGGSAAQMDLRVERQIRQNANPPAPPALKASQTGGAAAAAAKATQTTTGQQKSSTVSGNKKLSNNLPKPPKGKGSVPPNKRDPKRVFTKKEKAEKLKEQNGTCVGCGKEKSVDEVDGHHVVRHADGGKTEPDNLAALCKECHTEIHQ